MDSVTISIIIGSALLVVLLVALFYFIPIDLFITAQFSGVRIKIAQLIGMRLRKVQPKVIIDELIKAHKANLTDVHFNKLEAHFLANGNVRTVVDALISAKNAGIHLPFDQATAIDLAGRDVLQAVKDSVNTRVIETPQIESVALDGIQLIVKANITVRAHLDKLVGGAGEETIQSRVGQGIVGAIGSAETHKDIMANPSIISEAILNDGLLTAGTAYEVLSIDIADIDIGENIGAKLEADKAAAQLQVARAQAEEKRAKAVAEEQFFRAQVEKMRSQLIEAEAEVPRAISEAFRKGHLSIMDYQRIKNMESDTRMRQALSELSQEDLETTQDKQIKERAKDDE